jgi:hypothetical protein
MFLAKTHGNGFALRDIEWPTCHGIYPVAEQLQRDEFDDIMTVSDTAPASGEASDKISAEFAARLQRLAADEEIRALVLVRRPDTGPVGSAVPADREQSRHIEAAVTRERVQDAFVEVDQTLALVGGRRLTERPNALGHIVVETTRSGIESLCGLDCVGAILEDQPIHPHLPVNRRE